ncbi:hypothetical protein [Rhodospirillum rubrum]|uniref:hypothetical protein n=1 Tax=Rhodospirillum rubrum TaxID=1085 RepID=UPI0013E8D802|nr:hypothetical protein [Rhodospirillum rubrum]
MAEAGINQVPDRRPPYYTTQWDTILGCPHAGRRPSNRQQHILEFTMSVTVADFVNVAEQAIALGCPALEKIAVLPENFATVRTAADFLQRSEADTVRKLFRLENVPTDDSKPFKAPYIQNNGFEWVGPLIFIGAGVISDNANYVSVSLNLISNFLYDFFKTSQGKNTVKLNIVVEKQSNKNCKLITYEGDVAGMSSLPDIIREVSFD